MTNKRDYQEPTVESFDSADIVRLIGPALGYGAARGGVSAGALGDLTGRSGTPGHFGR